MPMRNSSVIMGIFPFSVMHASHLIVIALPDLLANLIEIKLIKRFSTVTSPIWDEIPKVSASVRASILVCVSC